MCQDPPEPMGVGQALTTLDHCLSVLATADAGQLTAAEQAQALAVLERAQARQTAARARMLAAFRARRGYEDDGQGSARAWLRWQTRITPAAAASATAWTKRLDAHPVIADALAAGELSASWGQEICRWNDRFPPGRRDDADAILVAAARGGADLSDLARLAREMYERSRQEYPDEDAGDGFGERGVWLGATLDGAGRLNGDLTPQCTAALSAVLDALSKKNGPEDTRTAAQRRHDALEEACRRLVAAGVLPARAGQPTQVQIHMTLAELRNMPGASEAEVAWLATRSCGPDRPAGAGTGAVACDATLAPVVTGHVDPAALDRMVEVFLTTQGRRPDGSCRCTCGGCTCATRGPLPPATLSRLRASLLQMAADVLSGPAGLAAWLRRSLLDSEGLATPSLPLDLPLDVAQPHASIPAHLRRAVSVRHACCAFPGCDQPAGVCQVHHLIPRSRGGATRLRDLVPLCTFHHLTVIHRWGWALRLHADGTTTATSPDGRVLRSHDPPHQAA